MIHKKKKKKKTFWWNLLESIPNNSDAILSFSICGKYI